MVAHRSISGNIIILTFLLLILGSGMQNIRSQSATYGYFYRVYFKDKGSYTVNDFMPDQLLSQRAIDRRYKSGVVVPDYKDLPVFKDYLNQIRSKGFVLHTTSKWMNTGLFKTQNPEDVGQILSLPFVSSVKVVKQPLKKGQNIDKFETAEENPASLPFDNPLLMVNGYSLHNSGYTGKGIIIAVLDGGFWQANIISSLGSLRARGGIKGTRDFVAGGSAVYGYHNHGTAVLSILAGSLPGEIAGTAPGADYWLLRTEDASTEFPVEEDFWAAGAEFADSLGADIISSSLGYYEFNDPSLNYKFSDMNGNTAFVTVAADIAASKGMLVIASAGNERNKTWKRIIAPSDGDSVLSAGAVDGYNQIAVFSSAGPAADGRIKPDNVAQGVAVPLQTLESIVSLGSGTSFSCPVLSGICACVMQAVPEANNYDIIEALHNKADKSSDPDSLYGYGVPDMLEVLGSLQKKYVPETGYSSIVIPNPVTGLFEIVYQEPPGTLEIEIFSASGILIFKKNYGNYIGRSVTISEIQEREAGIYIIRSKTESGVLSNKLIKVER
jgi:hypothetical protein